MNDVSTAVDAQTPRPLLGNSGAITEAVTVWPSAISVAATTEDALAESSENIGFLRDAANQGGQMFETLLQNKLRGWVPLVNTKVAMAHSKAISGIEINDLGQYRLHPAKIKN